VKISQLKNNLLNMAKTFLTKEGIEKLNSEINHLKTVEVRECIEAIAEARDKGDLSENAEYDAAKEKYDSVNDRIQKLQAILMNAVVINQESVNTDSVQILTTVSLKNIKTNKEVCYTIVPNTPTPNIKEGKISVNSPVAQALIGKIIGDVVKVTTPATEIEFEILNITA
jgi:transcription elongation factor GreA